MDKNPASVRENVLKEALLLTTGDRNDTYGDPTENHRQIADIFNAITGQELSAQQIVLVHVATKLARLSNAPLHNDSYVDLAAYAAIAREVAGKQTEDLTAILDPTEQFEAPRKP